jgi:hypothetical protein
VGLPPRLQVRQAGRLHRLLRPTVSYHLPLPPNRVLLLSHIARFSFLSRTRGQCMRSICRGPGLGLGLRFSRPDSGLALT